MSKTAKAVFKGAEIEFLGPEIGEKTEILDGVLSPRFLSNTGDINFSNAYRLAES